MSLAIAWIPSNQDRNRGALPGHNEAGNCRLLAHGATQKAIAQGVTTRYFEPALESADAVQYASLHTTFAQARAWLDQQAAAGLRTCAVHVHTNAAGTPQAGSSHTGYCFTKNNMESSHLGFAIASKVGLVLGLGLVAYDYTDWLFDRLLRPHVSTIIEVTRHDRKPDLEKLYASAELVEDALLHGAMAWAGVAAAAPATPGELEQLRAEVVSLRARLNQIADLARL